MDLKEVAVLGDGIVNHWYYRSKAEAITRVLAGISCSEILDVGAGSGFFSRHLLAHTAAKEAWCVDTSYDIDHDALERGKPLHYRRRIESTDADLVLLMDVLEHVDDDLALLQEYARKAPHGSRFVITAPAFEFLWSGHDDFLGHRRRYTLPQIEGVVREAGLQLTLGVYHFGAVLPIAACLRLGAKAFRPQTPARSELTSHSRIVNAALTALCRMELPLLKINRLAGLSVLCLATKR